MTPMTIVPPWSYLAKLTVKDKTPLKMVTMADVVVKTTNKKNKVF